MQKTMERSQLDKAIPFPKFECQDSFDTEPSQPHATAGER